MYYYKVLNNDGKVAYLLTYDQKPNITDPLYVEITADEHAAISAEFIEKDQLIDQLYLREITIDDVPTEWQEEVQSRVDSMIENFGPFDSEEISDSEALDIILGGETA